MCKIKFPNRSFPNSHTKRKFFYANNLLLRWSFTVFFSHISFKCFTAYLTDWEILLCILLPTHPHSPRHHLISKCMTYKPKQVNDHANSKIINQNLPSVESIHPLLKPYRSWSCLWCFWMGRWGEGTQREKCLIREPHHKHPFFPEQDRGKREYQGSGGMSPRMLQYKITYSQILFMLLDLKNHNISQGSIYPWLFSYTDQYTSLIHQLDHKGVYKLKSCQLNLIFLWRDALPFFVPGRMSCSNSASSGKKLTKK